MKEESGSRQFIVPMTVVAAWCAADADSVWSLSKHFALAY